MSKTPPIVAAPAAAPVYPRAPGGWPARRTHTSEKVAAARRAELLAMMTSHGFGPWGEGGKTTKAFAEKIGYSYGTLRQWTSGARVPSRYSLRAIKLLLTP